MSFSLDRLNMFIVITRVVFCVISIPHFAAPIQIPKLRNGSANISRPIETNYLQFYLNGLIKLLV